MSTALEEAAISSAFSFLSMLQEVIEIGLLNRNLILLFPIFHIRLVRIDQKCWLQHFDFSYGLTIDRAGYKVATETCRTLQ
jgi:hypothetical protein